MFMKTREFHQKVEILYAAFYFKIHKKTVITEDHLMSLCL